MKKFLLCIFLISGLNSFSQTQTKFPNNYLLVYFSLLYDNSKEKYYLELHAEGGSDSAKEIYSLIKYDNKKKAINADGVFYPVQNDTSALYNYFHSTTEALNYMLKKGWELLTVYIDISSGFNTERSSNGDLIPITKVSSRPIFCFKK